MHMKKLRDLFGSRHFCIALLAVMAAIFTNLFASLFIWWKYGEDLPVVPDLLLDVLPFFEIAWLYNCVPVLGFLVFFVVYAYNKAFPRIPYFLLLVGLFYIARGIAIVLTPIAYPNEPFTDFFLIKVFRFGVNPSGHSGSLFLFFLLSGGNYKKVFLAMTVLDGVLMLLGAAHYSIDIFASFFFSYSVYSLGEKHFSYFRLAQRT